MEASEMKRVIAIFDGFEFVNDAPEDYPKGYYTHKELGFLTIEEMGYDCSYQWLMPVWVKFRDLKFEDFKYQIEHSERKDIIGLAILYGEINIAFERLSEAITWYNQLNK